MFNLNQRSSIASSIVTALIGWVGMIVMATLFLQIPFCWDIVLPIALFCASVQLLFLKTLFFPLRLNKSVTAGVLWGGLSAAGLFFASQYWWGFINEDYWFWAVVFVSTGAPVGGFLSYFYIDDERIYLAQSFRKQVNFGRDALWLVPFVYGAGAYLLAFLPSLSLNVLLPAIVTGAMVGVAAAGISHYTADEWKFSTPALLALILLPGTAIGLTTGLLFDQFEGQLPVSPYIFSTAGGLLTFIVTLIKGRQLGRKEMEGRL